LEYTGADNARHRPVMIHRAIYGSLERFLATYLEHTAGNLPAWLAPVQVRVLGVRNDHDAQVRAIAEDLQSSGFRADWAAADEPLGARIRKAKLEKLPYILVVGDDDVAAGTVGVNARGKEVERGVPVDEFVARIRAEIDERRVDDQPAA
jgi:threonyl-tRNA synthetase